LHAPVASQLFTPLQAVPSSWFVTNVVHVPAELPQERQGVVHASAQQVLSTQLLLAQSVASVHDCPFLLLHSADALQVWVPLQLSSS